MKNCKRWTFLALMTALSVGVLAFSAQNASAKQDDKISICHAAGKAGTIKYTLITVAPSAAAKHLDPTTGTPKAGHEKDVLAVNGTCPGGVTPSPTPKPTPTASPTPKPTPTPTPTPTASPTPKPTPTPTPTASPTPKPTPTPTPTATPTPTPTPSPTPTPE